jgi:N-acetyl-gamma-glutamyl-phosphate reductase
VKVGIINVTGYSGSELARILRRHPEVEIASVTGRSAAGQKLGEVFPHLESLDLTIEPELSGSLDLVFSALPHKASAEACIPALAQGVKVVDISADFRLKRADEYEEWYGVEHQKPSLLEEAVYGLTELHRDEIRAARLVANPGCYPTGAILALAPAVSAGVISPDIIVSSLSGVSGGGRGLAMTNHFSEVNENAFAYAVNGHRHLPEIQQELDLLDSGDGLRITFMTHLAPMTRGILASCYAPLKEGSIASGDDAKAEIRDIYDSFYEGETFAKVVPAPPMTKHTLGNNDCVVYPTVDARTNRLVVFSCIDNLVKGAAGQAVQNMNLMFGLPEHQGITQLALYP